MPDQPCDGGHANQKHHGSDSEQETDEPNQPTHARSSVSALCAETSGVFLGPATDARWFRFS
jgi:hypothetical protein